MMFGFTANVGVALANTVILIGAVTRYLFEFNVSHPSKKATMIDYSIAILMLPAVMVGSFLGAQLNTVTPEVVLLFLLGSILCYLSYKSTVKAAELYKKDKEESSKRIESEKLMDNSEEIEMQEIKEPQLSWDASVVVNPDDSFKTKNLKQLKAGERTHFEWTKLLIIFLGFVSLLIISLIRQNQFEKYTGHIVTYSVFDLLL